MAQALGELLSAAEPLPLSVLEGQLLPTALSALEAAPLTPMDDNAVGAEWLHFLLLLLRTGRLPPHTLERQVLPWALTRGEVSSPVHHRLLCTHMLGAIAEAHPEPRWIESHFLNQALNMCQDTELIVRCSMCEQLHRLAAAVGPELAGAGPLSELLELTSDEHPEVRAAAFDCGVSMLTSCDPARRNELLEPAVRRTVAQCIQTLETSADASEPLVQRLSASLEKLLEALVSCGFFEPPLLDDSAPGGVSVYESLVVALSTANSVELRCECAQALPAAAAALRAQGDEAAVRLHACARTLRDDPDRDVRMTLLAALPRVAAALGTHLATQHTLPLVLWALERAEDTTSLLPLLSAMPDLIATLGDGQSESARLTLGQQLLPLLLQLEAPLAHNWRGMNAIITQYGTLTEYLEPQTLFSLTLPTLFNQLAAETAAPNRLEAVRVICQQLRKLRTGAQRTEVCNRLVRELGSASSYALRIDFLHACGLLLDQSLPCGCSHVFFKAHGLHHSLLALASDPVANVRLHLCSLLPPLKRTLRLPGDNDALQKLHHAVVALQSDSARDVRRAASLAEGSLRQFDMLTEGAALRRTSVGEEHRWETENADRLAEEEAMTKAEQESVADAKRRAADELAERARAAYANKFEEGVGRRGRDSQDMYSDRPTRSNRASREIPTHLTRAAMAAASSSTATSPGSASPQFGNNSGRKDAPWSAATSNPRTGPGATGVRRSSRDNISAAIEASSGQRPRRMSREPGTDAYSGASATSTVLPPLPRSRRTTH